MARDPRDPRYADFGLFVDGGWRPAAGGATYPVTDPATEETIGEAPAAGPADVAAAVASARRGLAAWRAVPSWERAARIRAIARLLTERKDTIAAAMTREVGKPLAQSAGEIQLAIDQFEWYAGETQRIHGQIVESRLPGGQIRVTHEPIGIVAAFTAWNFPAVLLARKIAPALAAGCSIICRPSEEAPGVAMHLIQACADAGLPPGTVNLLTGKASAITPGLMAEPDVRKISLTGSTAVGRRLIRDGAETLKRFSMELGGHAPVIVWDDVDAEQVAELCAQTKFKNAGQVCVSPSRYYLHEAVAEPFTRRFVEVARSLKLGNGFDADTEMGPLATRRRLEETEALVEDTRAEGARLLAGGGRPAGFNRGFFFEPTVFDQVADDGRLMTEEPFGPVVPIATFADFDDVIGRANSLELGLSAYLFTRDLKRADDTAEALESGMVGVNTFGLAQAEAPFGGIKQSGFGREGGSFGIQDYLNVKYTHVVRG